MTKTVEAKHIFLDIENYTYNRSVEAQSDILGFMNQIVKDSVAEIGIEDEKIIFIPTGDGMCISLIDLFTPFDAHILLAIEILRGIHKHNASQEDNSRQFNIRIGINENTDNLITDINDKNNISGSGINMASRIQGLADAGQILVGQTVYERLVQREKYMDSFCKYQASVKHGVILPVYQYFNQDLEFINMETPSNFVQLKKITTFVELDELQANYLYLCCYYKNFILQNAGNPMAKYSLKVALFHFAENERLLLAKSVLNPNPYLKVKLSFQEYFIKLQTTEFYVIADLQHFIIKDYLKKIEHFFEDNYLIVSTEGLSQLKKDFPKIYEKLEEIEN